MKKIIDAGLTRLYLEENFHLSDIFLRVYIEISKVKICAFYHLRLNIDEAVRSRTYRQLTLRKDVR